MKQTDKQNDFMSEQLFVFLQNREKEQHIFQKEEVWQRIIRSRRQAKIRRISIWSTIAAMLQEYYFCFPF